MISTIEGNGLEFQNEDVFQSLKIIFILAHSADPYEMLHLAAFHQGLHCLPKHPFTAFHYTNGLCVIYLSHCIGNALTYVEKIYDIAIFI